ncbi:MAG TPA: hypothetical protein VME46_08530 [Acidimicrobiales bacterium]|nr:hypothetical protein [Acidimicrobiales bacterium]
MSITNNQGLAAQARRPARTLTTGVMALVVPLLITGRAWAAGLPGTSGGGAAPPGVGTNIGTVIGWASWVCFVIAILGVMFVAFKLMVMHHRGEGGQHFASLLYVLGGAILVAAASGIIGALTTAA